MEQAAKPHNIFIFAGEASGDKLGASLAAAIKEQVVDVVLKGVCGPMMRLQGVEGVYRSEDFAVMGLTDVLMQLPKLYLRFHKIVNYLMQEQPVAVILIDYPYFNLRLAQRLRAKGFKGKLCHYICPSVWAHGKERIDALAAHYDLLLAIFPFEKELFSQTSLKVVYVGNPISERIQRHAYDTHWRAAQGIDAQTQLVALFPGSRRSEVKRNLPSMMIAAALLKQSHPHLHFAISCGNAIAVNEIKKQAAKYGAELQSACIPVTDGSTYDLMRNSIAAIAKSGTVTLELALHHCPSVVIYEVSLLNRLYAKKILKLDVQYFCLANIIARRELFPELIKQQPVDPENIATKIQQLIDNAGKRADVISSCRHISQQLATSNGSAVAANAILELIS